MDYRRRYQRKLANQAQDNQNEGYLNNYKNEIKSIQTKVEDNTSLYLQKLLGKNNNSPKTSSIYITRANENVTNYSNNIKEAFPTEENKQKGGRYMFHKRNEDKYGTEYIKEESNPISSKYYNYNRYTNINPQVESIKSDLNSNKINNDFKNAYQNYLRRNRINVPEANNNQENDYNKKEQSNVSLKKRFPVSSSATNIIINNKATGKEETNNNNSIFFRTNINNNQIINNDNENKKASKEKNDKNQTRYKYYRGFNKRNDNEQNDKKEENDDKKGISSIPINLGYNNSS